MQPYEKVSTSVANIKNPPFWLVLGLPWPDGSRNDTEECAQAIAPTFIPREAQSRPVQAILDFGVGLHRKHGMRVLFLSELTGFLRRAQASWAEIGVPDFDTALNELLEVPTPALFMSLTQHAHMLLCTAGNAQTISHSPENPAGRTVDPSEYAELKKNLQGALERDWPAYIDDLTRSGHLRGQ
ncbi:hypothetical protein SAMN05216207_104726 [Pseudonocardia ammonioxydans]|uniref:Uncharacterized protein n=1 Tax=Pseudonocardia ammonioxydans TaxID=260086 RepID=A0A1I5GJC4_PSUAM|nr:hypothetical protein SAMN05216207_104726 [Pseudonocardia ammonioxydans]